MKVATFLITLRALKIIFGDACKTIPFAWFNWTTADGTLSRFMVIKKITPEMFAKWLAVVRANDCVAVVMLTSGDDPLSRYYGIDSERNHLSITVDMLDETDLWRLRVDTATPESEYLEQWAGFALGAGIPFGWLRASRCVWCAYADGLRAWASEPSARKWLADLNAIDYTPISAKCVLKLEEFKIPTKINQEDLEHSFFPSKYNPAFAVGFKDGAITTFGIRAEPDEWKFDKSGAIRAQLEALKASALQTT